MNANDRLALELGRTLLRAVLAEEQLAQALRAAEESSKDEAASPKKSARAGR